MISSPGSSDSIGSRAFRSMSLGFVVQGDPPILIFLGCHKFGAIAVKSSSIYQGGLLSLPVGRSGYRLKYGGLFYVFYFLISLDFWYAQLMSYHLDSFPLT